MPHPKLGEAAYKSVPPQIRPLLLGFPAIGWSAVRVSIDKLPTGQEVHDPFQILSKYNSASSSFTAQQPRPVCTIREPEAPLP